MSLSQELPTARRDCRLSRLSIALLALDSVPPSWGWTGSTGLFLVSTERVMSTISVHM